MRTALAALFFLCSCLSVAHGREAEDGVEVYVRDAQEVAIEGVNVTLWYRADANSEWSRSLVRFTNELGWVYLNLEGHGQYRIELQLDGYMNATLGPFWFTRSQSIPSKLEAAMNATIQASKAVPPNKSAARGRQPVLASLAAVAAGKPRGRSAANQQSGDVTQ